MSDIAIKLKNISKHFKLYKNAVTGPVSELLFFWKKEEYYEKFEAIKNVDLEVKRGEVVGIIGPNGAGKTTLLKIIAGLLPHDSGSVEINGKVTALLALGVGINPEFTGRENILYHGLLLGMSKREVLSKMQSIIDFAEIGDFIDRPIRTYSSGMRARLLFATSMSIDPDILIVDEALATGDSYFVEKCKQRIKEICKSGATVLFVSHNLKQVEELCDRVILFSKGQIIVNDDYDTAVKEYVKLNFAKEKEIHSGEVSTTDLAVTSGNGKVVMVDMALLDRHGNVCNGFQTFDEMSIKLVLDTAEGGPFLTTLFIGFMNYETREYIGGINSSQYYDAEVAKVTSRVFDISGRTIVELQLKPLLLMAGHYSLWVEFSDNYRNIYSEYKNVASFYVGYADSPLVSEAYFYHGAKICMRQG